MMLKKAVALFIVSIMLFVTASCKSKAPTDETTGDNSVSAPAQEISSGNDAETTVAEETSADVGTVWANGSTRCFYGEKTSDGKTFTGLKPLDCVNFTLTDEFNSKGLSDEQINHSYGVAKDSKPHEISIQNQKFFDDGNYDAICLDNKSSVKVLYLTFDCGYENGYTAKILDTLKSKNVTAAFFCTLQQMKDNPEIIARMINEGHIVGNHSVTHPDFSSLTRKQMLDEIKGFDDYIRTNFGYSSLYFRYPQGKYSINSLELVNSLGYKCVFWSLAYADWDLDNQKGSEYALNTVVSRLHPGAVMLLHAVSPDNAAALGGIIDTARGLGYEFASLEDLPE